jgi:hypothetical protein
LQKVYEELYHSMVEKKSMPEKKPAKDLNKSEEIRKLAKVMKEKGEKPRPVVIVATLKKQGIDVSSPQVSMVLKRMGFRPRKRRPNGSPSEPAATRTSAIVRKSTISVEDLITAKKVVAQLGGTDRALAAIAALKRFES